MLAKHPLMPASEPGLGLASQPGRAWVASSQPVTWPLRASELAKLGLQVPGRAELLERLPGAPRRAPR